MKVMKLHLYQSIPYLVSETTVDFFSPLKTLKQLDSLIYSFAGDAYSCQEAAVFGRISPSQTPIGIGCCKAGFSLTRDTSYIIPAHLSHDVFYKGIYAFAQFPNQTPKGIHEAVKVLFDYIDLHHLQPADDNIMLRMVKEAGGMLTGDLEEYAFQLCIALN